MNKQKSENCGAGIPACDLKTTFRSYYRRRLPHLRNEDAIFFVTWRLAIHQPKLTGDERSMVQDIVLYFNYSRYRLIASVVMDDHVHVLVQPQAQFQLHSLVHSWKSYSAQKLGKPNCRMSPIWQDEYFDRIMRNIGEVAETVDYIRNNPAKRWPGYGDYPWYFEDAKDFLG